MAMKHQKQREHFIYIGCSEPFEKIYQTQDSFILPDDGRTYWIFHRLEYPRERKPKVVFLLFDFFGSRAIKINPSEELRKYDQVFCIDTNYMKLAVTTAKRADWLPERGDFAVRHLFTKAFTPSSSYPEREAWRDFIEQMNENSALKVCLVVDSELDTLVRINKRETPLVNDYFLPKNWQLNYASSDVNEQFIMVRMMRMCDNANRKYKIKNS